MGVDQIDACQTTWLTVGLWLSGCLDVVSPYLGACYGLPSDRGGDVASWIPSRPRLQSARGAKHVWYNT